MTEAVRSVENANGMRLAMPIMGAVFLSFMVMGMALPVLPLHVHDVLGFGPFTVGLVAGGQFVAALVSRLWAGRLADSRGPKQAVVLGLVTAIFAGAFYFVSLEVSATPLTAVTLIFLGRTLMGGAESLIITGGMTWALGLTASNQAARSIAWVGMAMFAAMAIGAPLGSVIFAKWAFAGIAITTIALPCLALMMTQCLRPYLPPPTPRAAIRSVFKAVMLPGLGFALSGITFGAVTAFLPLLFSVKGWSYGAVAFSAFAITLIVTRIAAGHLPDRIGGAKVALCCLTIQAIGLGLIGLASTQWLAMAGVIICGGGFSLVFPSFGLEAVRLAPSESRGLAMGLYNAFLDLTLGIVSPTLGLLGSIAGIETIFIASAIAALGAVPIAWMLLRRRSTSP